MFAWFTEWRRYRKFWAFLFVGTVWALTLYFNQVLPGLEELVMVQLGVLIASLAGERIPNA
jgi:hypothetical protein